MINMLDKTMTRKPRFLLASLIAPIATLFAPFIGFIDIVLFDESDDASAKIAASFLIVLMPIAYLLLSFGMYAVGEFLWERKKLSVKNVLVTCLLLSGAFSSLLSFPGDFDISEKISDFTTFGLLALFCTVLGASLWWFLARLGHDDTPIEKL